MIRHPLLGVVVSIVPHSSLLHKAFVGFLLPRPGEKVMPSQVAFRRPLCGKSGFAPTEKNFLFLAVRA